VKIPQIEDKKLKVKNSAFLYPNLENYPKGLPEINDFVSPSSVVYYVAKSTTSNLKKWYKKLFSEDLDIVSEAKKSKHHRSSEYDNGFIKHVVLYASLIKFLKQVDFDRATHISKLSLTKSTAISKLLRSFKYGDRSNVFNEYGVNDILIKRKPKKSMKEIAEDKEKLWPDVLKAARDEGHSKKVCEQYKEKFILYNKGVFMMALANHKNDKKKRK